MISGDKKRAKRLKKTILYIEDGRALTHVMSNKLKREGFEVALATDGVEGLRIAQQVHPDLILLDLIMPNMDGFEVLRAIRKDILLGTTPVIIFTNLGQESDREKSMKLGATDYLIKSDISIKDTVEKIKSYLTKHT